MGARDYSQHPPSPAIDAILSSPLRHGTHTPGDTGEAFFTKCIERDLSGSCSVPGVRGSDHVVRSWPHLFQAMLDGVKTHDLRKDDRNYQVGDVILHREYDIARGAYTGREQQVEVTYITGRNEGQSPCAVSSVVLDPEYVILSIRKI